MAPKVKIRPLSLRGRRKRKRRQDFNKAFYLDQTRLPCDRICPRSNDGRLRPPAYVHVMEKLASVVVEVLSSPAAHLVDAVEDVVGGGVAEGVDDLAEDDRHDGLRDAVGQRPHRAEDHEQHVRAVGVPEQPRERHLLPSVAAAAVPVPVPLFLLLHAIPPFRTSRCVHCVCVCTAYTPAFGGA